MELLLIGLYWVVVGILFAYRRVRKSATQLSLQGTLEAVAITAMNSIVTIVGAAFILASLIILILK